VQFGERVEPEIAAHRRRQAGEDLPVRPAQTRGGPNRRDPLPASLPVGEMPVLLDRRGGRQEGVGERLERPELKRLDDLHGHVLQGAPSERSVGQIPKGVDADQEQHVDLARGARLEDLHRRATGFADHDRAPYGLDLGTLGRRVEAATTRQEIGVHACAQRALVVRAARGEREPGARRRGELERGVGRTLGQAGTGEHHGRVPRLAELSASPKSFPRPSRASASTVACWPGRQSTCSATSCRRVRRG